jgi:hypothetical protein
MQYPLKALHFSFPSLPNFKQTTDQEMQNTHQPFPALGVY